MEKLEIKDESELVPLAQKVIQKLSARAGAHASVLALEGDLGAGKTAFVKVLAQELGVDEEVTSPTFVIMKFYSCGECPEKITPFESLVHVDAYRIENIKEMQVLNFEEVLAQKDTLVCIEWADRIAELLPQDALKMHIVQNADDSRTVTFE